MNFSRRLVSALATAAVLCILIGISISGAGQSGSDTGSLFSRKTTLHFWYTNDALTDYLNEVAVSYNEAHSRVRVEPQLIENAQYLEKVNSRTVNDMEDFPDIYIISNDSLEKAYMAGLASEVQDTDHFDNGDTFPQSATDAVTYDGKIVAYPMYFDAAALLYNTEYVQSMADDAGQSLEETVPSTLVELVNLANSYDAPEGVEAVFKWDVSDIFYNYYIVGNYMNVGGEYGDDPDQIDIYNQGVIAALKAYQQLNQIFSIDTKTDDYESVLQDFADGRIVFTVATGDAAATLAELKTSGESDIEYGVVRLPDITDDVLTRTMSVTNTLVVNGYSEHQKAANDFIHYLLYENMDDFYERTGKIPASLAASLPDEHLQGFADAYRDSVPVAKMRQASNLWMYEENAFAQIWNGADVNDTVKSLYEQLMLQITGEPFTADPIEDPEPIDILGTSSGGE